MEGYFLPYRYLGYLQPCKYWIKDVNECVFKMDHTQPHVFKMDHAQPLVFFGVFKQTIQFLQQIM